jgi:chromosome segregation ATPase
LPIKLMAEGSETPNGEPGIGPEGRSRRSEGDLFAERRARRAAESGEDALTRRAEAAEATVQTLERHVASLQQRLSDAEDERLRIAELVETEQAATVEREHELRRVKQREYAEQQLRVEAEDRLLLADRESRIEIERLSNRLNASERDARELALRLDGVQRQLAETEQAAAADRAAVRADLRSVAEQNLQERLTELERRAVEIQHGLEAERAAREQSERLLESMRQGHRRMETLLGEMKDIVARVSGALASESQATARAEQALAPERHGAEMADALAAAVERLRARAEAVAVTPTQDPATASITHEAAVPAAPRERLAPVVRRTSDAAIARPPHKHSLSWFARRRIKRKQRRERRAQ